MVPLIIKRISTGNKVTFLLLL